VIEPSIQNRTIFSAITDIECLFEFELCSASAKI
jgi:hypothetical protein